MKTKWTIIASGFFLFAMATQADAGNYVSSVKPAYLVNWTTQSNFRELGNGMLARSTAPSWTISQTSGVRDHKETAQSTNSGIYVTNSFNIPKGE